jgi:hypothetical protein
MGLGNEMIPWAKAYIAARSLNLRLLHPAWGLNPRNYARYFGTSRMDWLAYRALGTMLPMFEFRESDLASSESLDDALIRFSACHKLAKRSAFVVGLSGLWGGMDILHGARSFLLGQLLATRWTIENLYDVDRHLDREKLRVGIHIRRGDFSAAPEDRDYRTKFNVAIPFEWYGAIVRTLVARFGDRVEFVVVSDAPAGELAPLFSNVDCVTTAEQRNTDISDLLALSFSDLIVCSISSFSLWAAFLGQSRYVWLDANLVETDGYRSIWGHEPKQASEGGAIRAAFAANDTLLSNRQTLNPRGAAVGWDGTIPESMLGDLDRTLSAKRRSTDLIRFGAVPIDAKQGS